MRNTGYDPGIAEFQWAKKVGVSSRVPYGAELQWERSAACAVVLLAGVVVLLGGLNPGHWVLLRLMAGVLRLAVGAWIRVLGGGAVILERNPS